MNNKFFHSAESGAHKRFIVSGRALLEMSGRIICGEIVSISLEEMLVKGETNLSSDSGSTIDFSVSIGGGRFLIVGQGTVVWIRLGEMSIKA
jgi:hypothetical protein